MEKGQETGGGNEEDGQGTHAVYFDGSGPQAFQTASDISQSPSPTQVFGSSEGSANNITGVSNQVERGDARIAGRRLSICDIHGEMAIQGEGGGSTSSWKLGLRKLSCSDSSVGRMLRRLNSVERALDQIFEQRQKNLDKKIRRRLSLVDHEMSPSQLYIANYVYSGLFESFIGFVTIVNLLMVIIDTDLAAADSESPLWLKVGDMLVMGIFSLELSMRIYVERSRVVRNGWNLLDMLVVFSGLLQFVLDNTHADAGIMGPVRTLRCLRVLRIIKAFVFVNQLKELRRMVQGVAACFKVLVWALLMVFIFSTMWATVAVEMLNPIMPSVTESLTASDANDSTAPSAWHDCPRCHRAFGSVMSANLTLFQTILGGDSWGKVAIPVIEHYPWAALIFVGSLFTIQIGILNLVIAVLVDAAAESREHDVAARSLESEQAERIEKRSLERIFRQVDADGSGALSLDELLRGAEDVTEFQQKLRVMDIQGEDLHQLFNMLDEDESGEIDPDEFIETLYRMKCGDNKTAATFVKHYVVHLKKKQGELVSLLAEMNTEISHMRHEIVQARVSSKERFDRISIRQMEDRHEQRHKQLAELTSDLRAGSGVFERQSSGGTNGPGAKSQQSHLSSDQSVASAPISPTHTQFSSQIFSRQGSKERQLSASPPTTARSGLSSAIPPRAPSVELLSSRMPSLMERTISPGSDIQRSQGQLPEEHDSDAGSGDKDNNSSADDSDGACSRSKAWERPAPELPGDKVNGHKQARDANSQSGHWHWIPRSPKRLPRLSDPIGEIDGLIRKAIEQTLDPKQSKRSGHTPKVPPSLFKGNCGRPHAHIGKAVEN